jgi:hypothetical protein
MRTRRGLSYHPRENNSTVTTATATMTTTTTATVKKRDFVLFRDQKQLMINHNRKKRRISPEFSFAAGDDVGQNSTSDDYLFNSLPDDLVISILCKLSLTAGSPSDFINVSLTYVIFFFIYD